MQQFVPVPIPMKQSQIVSPAQKQLASVSASGGEDEWNESLYVGG